MRLGILGDALSITLKTASDSALLLHTPRFESVFTSSGPLGSRTLPHSVTELIPPCVEFRRPQLQWHEEFPTCWPKNSWVNGTTTKDLAEETRRERGEEHRPFACASSELKQVRKNSGLICQVAFLNTTVRLQHAPGNPVPLRAANWNAQLI